MEKIFLSGLVALSSAQLSDGDRLLGLNVVADASCRTSNPPPGCRGDGLRFCRTSSTVPGGASDWMLCPEYGSGQASVNTQLASASPNSFSFSSKPNNAQFNNQNAPINLAITNQNPVAFSSIAPIQQVNGVSDPSCNCPSQCTGSMPLCVQRSQAFTTTTVPLRGMKIGFIADTGASKGFQSVLDLLRRERVDAVIHAGDMGYGEGGPDKWNAMINAALGSKLTDHMQNSIFVATPFIAVLGNHDIVDWTALQVALNFPNNFSLSWSYTVICDRAHAMGTCEGQPGIKMTCTLPGITIVTVSPGTMGSGHAEYVTESFARYPNIWRVCVFHKVMRLLNAAHRGDEAGWPVYEACRQSGAMVLNGHAHLYSRSVELSSYEAQTMATRDPSHITLQPGLSFSAVVGTGGIGTEQTSSAQSNPWWGAVYGDSAGHGQGCLLCTFNEQDARTARCEFKTPANQVLEIFRKDKCQVIGSRHIHAALSSASFKNLSMLSIAQLNSFVNKIL